MTLHTKENIDGTFECKLDYDESFQSCMCSKLLLNLTYLCIYICISGLSADTLLKLSAGVHNITVKFIPTNFPDLSVIENHKLEIQPIGNFQYICRQYVARY